MPSHPVSHAIPPLRRRMLEDMAMRGLREDTQRNYVRFVRSFAAFLRRSPDTAMPEDIRRFQVQQAESGVQPPSINCSVSALRFLFTVTLDRPDLSRRLVLVRYPLKLPTVLSVEEVGRLLQCAPGPKHRAALGTAYGAGLRVSEVAALKVGDVDSTRMLIRVEQGKGRKDRYVMLSPKLLDVLRDYWRAARPKQWLFPGEVPGKPISACAVEVVCRNVRDQLGISKPITPHSLRHAFAVHMLEGGTDVRTIQLLLGHRSLNTTARYLCLATNKVCAAASPFERLQAPSSPAVGTAPTAA
jgi:integrase/recombinase XerD